MVVRSDITIDWHLSPRIIRIAAPSTDISIQDLHDTLRYLEQLPNAMQYPHLLETSGKQVLGPSVFVGLTSALQNAKIAFEPRVIIESVGTITTEDTSGTLLIDSGATFITDGVEPGSWISNTTDKSLASVITVISETQLFTFPLDGGTDNQFNVLDEYKILAVIQMEVAGGNLVAVDGYGDDIDSILPTAGTQVVRTSSSSATLQELQDIQFSSFTGVITCDVIGGTDGTIFPAGTPRQPTNNFEDALVISATTGIKKFAIIGNTTLENNDFRGFTIIGESHLKSNIFIASTAQVGNAEFQKCVLSGTICDNTNVSECLIGDLAEVAGDMSKCSFDENTYITLAGDSHITTTLQEGIGGDGYMPKVDMNGDGYSLSVRNYFGEIMIVNKSGPEPVVIGLSSGIVHINSTVTNGTITIRGVGTVVDDSTGTTVVIDTDLVSPESVAAAVKPTILPLYSGL